MPAPSKSEQEAESRARAQSGVDPAENAAAMDIIDDNAPGDPGDAQARSAPRGEGDQPQRQAPPPLSAGEQRRANIVDRWKKDRTEEVEAIRDTVSDFERSGMPPEFEQFQEQPAAGETAADAGADEGAAPQGEPPAPPALPPRIKLKVHGEEKEYSLEEVVANAQIALASDNILGKAKDKLKEVDDLLRDTKSRVARPDPAGHHADQSRPQPTADNNGSTDVDPAASPTSEDDPIDRLIETIQFGDKNDAKPLLRQTIKAEAKQIVSQEIQADRLRDESARTAAVIQSFKKENAELDNDPMARAAIQQRIFELQVEDLKAIGVDPDAIQKPDGSPIGPADIAQAHLWYRSNGYKLKRPETMLVEARDQFLEWKGVKKPPSPEPADPAAPKVTPRVEVHVDRDARRAAIPQTPTRAATPQPAPRPQTAQRQDASSVVQNMMASRNRPRGRVGVA